MGSCVILALLSTTACGWISVEAQGSGIPELKTILSGVNIYKYLTPKTLIAKVLGLVFIQSAGFHIGFEGPIIHCSSIISEMFTGLNYFASFGKRNFNRVQMLTTAVAAGVVSTFGTPYGGIVFSIELCSSVYLLSNLYKAFVCGAIGSFLYKYFHSFQMVYTIHKADEFVESITDVIHFIIVGIICGYASSLLIFMSSKVISAKIKSKIDIVKK